jgi:hypothetical protein
MTSLFHSIAGQRPLGADLLREQLRWTDAERRWHSAPHGAPADRPTQEFPPPGNASLLRGAMLTRLTMAGATAIRA